MNTTKRLYFYGVAFVSLAVTASGVAVLLRYVTDLVLGRLIAGSAADPLAVGLAMVVVGGPLWGLHWALAQRQVARRPEETGAALRAIYLYGMMLVAAVLAFLQVRSLLQWALGVEAFQSGWAGRLVAWGAVWGYHYALSRREGRPSQASRTLWRWYSYVGSGYGLVVAGLGLASILTLLFGRAYDGLTGTPTLASPGVWAPEVKRGLASLATGGLWWAFHWLYVAKDDTESALRQVYLYLFAFLGGAVTMLVSAGRSMFLVLQWALGAPAAATATQHFRSVTAALAAFLVGAALLLYHWQVVQEESEKLAGRLPGARRSFGYIMSGLGIGGLAAGAIVLVGLLVGVTVPAAREPLVGTEAWRNPLALSLTLLALGAPLWYWHWTKMQRGVRTAGVEERGALSRRIYVYGTLGALALLALGSLVAFLTMFLSDALKGDFGLQFLREGKWALGVVVTAAALLPYHWQVLREDQRVGAEAAAARKTVTLVIGGGQAVAVAEAMEKALGMPLLLVRLISEAPAPELSEARLAQLRDEIRATPSDKVILIADGNEIRVYGYK